MGKIDNLDIIHSNNTCNYAVKLSPYFCPTDGVCVEAIDKSRGTSHGLTSIKFMSSRYSLKSVYPIQMRLFPDLRTPQKTADILLEYRTGDTIVGDYPEKKGRYNEN